MMTSKIKKTQIDPYMRFNATAKHARKHPDEQSARGAYTEKGPHGRKLWGTTEIMDMRTRSAQFSKGRIPSENQRRKGERIHFLLFCILYHSPNNIPSCIYYIPRNFYVREVLGK